MEKCPKGYCCEKMPDKENIKLSLSDNSESSRQSNGAGMSKVRWAYSLCVIAYGMAFNGFVYGFTRSGH